MPVPGAGAVLVPRAESGRILQAARAPALAPPSLAWLRVASFSEVAPKPPPAAEEDTWHRYMARKEVA